MCQELSYQIYATLNSFYFPLSVMVAVYYQIFQVAKQIVDEEKKSQSHLLMTSNAAASSLTAGSRSSRCNSALVIRCHGDWQNHPEQMRSSIDSNCSS